LSKNSFISSLTGLSGLGSIGGYLSITENAAMTSLVGFNGVTTIGFYLFIDRINITDLEGFNNLVSVNTSVTLTSLPYLQNLQVGHQ